MSPLHPAEVAWRAFRKSSRLSQIEGEKRPTPSTIFPRFASIPMQARAALNDLGSTYIVMAAYRDCKFIANVDEKLWADLQDARWPASFPMEHVLLPRPCTIFAVGEMLYACVQWEGGIFVATNTSPYPETMWTEFLQFRSSFATVGESWDWYEPVIRRDSTLYRADAGALLNTILYALGEHDVVMQTESTAKSHHSRAKRDLSEPARVIIGADYARIIDRHAAKASEGSTTGEGEGGTKRPHVRGAHSHLYWTGPGRTIPRVRYLPPIPIHGGKPAQNDEAPTEIKIR